LPVLRELVTMTDELLVRRPLRVEGPHDDRAALGLTPDYCASKPADYDTANGDRA
jgi:hypothetical protein